MTEWHPSHDHLEQFMRGDLNQADSREVVLHLLSGCGTCQDVARAFFPCEKRAEKLTLNEAERAYAGVFQRVLPEIWEDEVEVAESQMAAEQLFAELLRHPHERRLLLVRNSSRFSSAHLCELVLDRGYRGSSEPSEARKLVELGVELASALDPRESGDLLVNDLRARSYAYLGNSARIHSDFRLAYESFDKAEAHLIDGSGDPIEQARVADLKGNLLADQNKFKEAFRLLDKAIGVYRRVGEPLEEARVLIVKGLCLGDSGSPDQAIRCLRKALPLIRKETAPRLVLAANHNLVYQYYVSGRYHQAMALIPETRKLLLELGGGSDQMRFRWLEGLIARDAGDLGVAEESFLEVKSYFLEEEMAHDVALASLDLSLVYLRENRFPEIKALAGEMLTIFRALQIHREVLASLVLFRKAVEMERVTSGLVRDLAAYLKSSRSNPSLPFRPSSSK